MRAQSFLSEGSAAKKMCSTFIHFFSLLPTAPSSLSARSLSVSVMKVPLSLVLAAATAHAAPQLLNFQDSPARLDLEQPLRELSTDDFGRVQEAIHDSFAPIEDRRRPSPAYRIDESSPISSPQIGFPHPPGGPPPTLDFSHLSILEIVNASLHRHHDHPHGEGDSFSPTVIDEKDPAHLPLHRLAWLVNFSSDAQEYLQRDGEFPSVSIRVHRAPC